MYKKGDIYLANLNPNMGREQSGIRPIVIFSGDTFNENNALVIVLPLTSQIKNFHGGIIIHPDKENGLSEISEILTFQIRCLSTERLMKKLGCLSEKELSILMDGLGDILTL